MLISLMFVNQQITTAQHFNCNVDYPPGGVSSLKSSNLTDVSVEKLIRIIVHLPLKTNGTGNFTETSDYYGVSNQLTL